MLKKVPGFRMPADSLTITVPLRKLRFPLRLRPASRADKYRKIHSPYAQSVLEMIRSSGVPAPLRRLCPVLENGDGRIVWVYGSPLAAAFAAGAAASGPFARITLIP